MNQLKYVYLDNNASTKVDDRVIEYMNNFYSNDYAVASSQFSHTPGIKAKEAVIKARYVISRQINAQPDEIIFTSGATEANNLAIKGLAKANKDHNKKRIIISSIEDFSVLNSALSLETQGYVIKKVKVDNQGFLNLNHLVSLINRKTLLVSIIYGNHEVGTIQNIKKISQIVHKYGCYLHTNAAAIFMKKPINVKKEGIDLMSLSAHKIHGPKGIGALYIKKGVPIEKIIDGGYQEFNYRAGTENVPGIAGFGKAVEIFSQTDIQKVKKLRDFLYEEISSNIQGIQLNGSKDMKKRLPDNLNVSFDFVEGESIVLHLDMRGIAVITGSACFSRALQASHILLAMGFTHERAHSSIRFSLSKYLTKPDIKYTIKNLKEVVEKLRELSPLVSVKS